MVLKEILQNEILSVVQFILVIAMGLIITKIVTDFLSKWMKSQSAITFVREIGYDEPLVELILVGVKYLLYFVTFVVAIAQFGFATMVFDIIIIIIALFLIFVIIFSLKDFIPNITAGLYLARVKSIKKGDMVRVGTYFGEVIELNLFTTTLKDENNRLIIIPNSNLTKKEIIKGEAFDKSGED